jgi:nuclear-control-of-ATPase protein 2
MLNLASAVIHTLGQTTTASSTSQTPKLDRESIKRALQLIRESPVLVIGALFPSTIRQGEEGGAAASKADSSSGQQSQKLLVARARALSPLGLTRHEARAKKRQLLKQRDELATKLGSLAQSLSNVPHNAGSTPEKLLQELTIGIHSMQAALGVQATSFRTDATSAQLSSSLNTLLAHYVSAQQGRVDLILSPSPLGSGPPSTLSRLWPTMILAPVATIIIIRVVTSSWDTIVEKAIEGKETVKGFAINWVYEPCLKLLDTIRTGEQDGVIMSKESLSSDLQSLERMVTEFSSEKYGLKGPELEAVTQKVREGDMTTVLKIYESELKVSTRQRRSTTIS